METELLPVVDLRSLSQSDLDALAAASAHALAPGSCPDADPLLPLKIDRALFNESAGSRKQTFSRLRLGTAAAASSSKSPPVRSTSAQPSTVRNDPDRNLVAYHLRGLFVPDDPSLPPPTEPQTLALTEFNPPSLPPDPDRETTNAKGISVDLVRLAGMVEPYDEELRRRTAGMVSETELQGFIASVAGKWVSQRQRRKNVDASFFGDHLPRGWKLQLGLKRKDGTVWVRCFSYVSPKGNQFSTCKEVSAYLMSLLGYPEVTSVTNQHESTGQLYLCASNGADNVLGSQDQIGSLNCQRCYLTFSNQTAYEQHHFSCYELSAKKRRTGKFGEPVVGRNGNFECPICQKTFEEESRYFGHVGSHARYQGLTPEAFFDKATSTRVIHGSLAVVSDGEAGFQHHNHSNGHGGTIVNKTSAAASRCFDPSYGPYGQAQPFANKNNTTVYQANLGSQPVYPMSTTADCLASCQVQPKNSGKERDSQVDITFSGGNTERDFTQFSNSFTHIKPNASSRCSQRESNTLGAGNFSKGSGSDVNCMKGSLANRGDVNFTNGSFANRPINNNEPNVPMLEVMGKSNNEMQNRYNDCVPGCQPNTASRTGRNVDGLMSTQANFVNMSSAVQSAGDVPVTSTSQDQCDLQLGFGAQKQQIFSSRGELRSAAAGSPQLGNNARNSSLPTGSTQFGSMDKPKSFPSGTPQFGSFARPNSVPAAPSHQGSIAQPNYVHSSAPSQSASMVQPNSISPESSQFGKKGRPDSVPPANTSQFRSMAVPNSVPPAQSSQFGSMARPNSVPHESSQSFGGVARPNSAAPVESSQFGSMARTNSVHPAVSSQFGNMPIQNFVSTSEPTLVLGYAPQMGSVPPPAVQLGWDSSLPRMVTGGSMVTCVCIWCNSQFHHFGPVEGQHAGSFGFICPSCRDRMSGNHNMTNNGSWQS